MQFPDSKHLIRVWLATSRASLIREMEFRGSFILGIIRQCLWLGVFILWIEIAFQNTSDIAGWNRGEILTILALSRLIEGIMNVTFINNVMRTTELVQQGTFDFRLTKPLPTQFSTFFQRISWQSLGQLFSGLILFIYVWWRDPAIFTLSHTFLAIPLAGLGIVIYYSLLVIIASLAFFVERLNSLWAFQNMFSEPLTVPFDIFPKGPRIALTYLLPIAFVVFVPAQALTGRLQWWQIPVAILIAAIFLTLANIVWRAGLRRYSSASS